MNNSIKDGTKVTDFFESADDYERLLEEAERQAMTKWEQNFVAEMKERFESYGNAAYLTIHQLDKVRDISE